MIGIMVYGAALALCVAFVDTLGPAKDLIVVAAFVAVGVSLWRAKPRCEAKSVGSSGVRTTDSNVTSSSVPAESAVLQRGCLKTTLCRSEPAKLGTAIF